MEKADRGGAFLVAASITGKCSSDQAQLRARRESYFDPGMNTNKKRAATKSLQFGVKPDHRDQPPDSDGVYRLPGWSVERTMKPLVRE